MNSSSDSQSDNDVMELTRELAESPLKTVPFKAKPMAFQHKIVEKVT